MREVECVRPGEGPVDEGECCGLQPYETQVCTSPPCQPMATTPCVDDNPTLCSMVVLQKDYCNYLGNVCCGTCTSLMS